MALATRTSTSPSVSLTSTHSTLASKAASMVIPNSLTNDLRIEGVQRLLKDGLRMAAESTLLVLYQDELADLANLVSDVAKTLNIRADARRFTASDFAGKYPASFSPVRLAAPTPIPQGIVLLIEWSVRTAKGRLELLRDLQSTGQGMENRVNARGYA